VEREITNEKKKWGSKCLGVDRENMSGGGRGANNLMEWGEIETY